jgi:hypothetical protein
MYHFLAVGGVGIVLVSRGIALRHRVWKDSVLLEVVDACGARLSQLIVA